MKLMEPTAAFHREAARKILLRHLFDGKIIQEERTSWLMLPTLEKVSRVNVAGTILVKERIGNITNILIDDGTGQVPLRFFEVLAFLEEIQVGQAVVVIGKPRAYNQEMYLSPEIVKKVLPVWLQVRKKELEQEYQKLFPEPARGISPARQLEEGKVIIMEHMVVPAEQAVEDISLPLEKVVRLIRELDQGKGVFIEELLQKSPLPETEWLVKKLLERGEIFQNTPGKVKVL